MEILPEIFSDVKKRMKKNDPAHDFEHVMRVFSNAEKICKKENVNKKLVLYSALLHDIVSFPKNDKRSKNSSTKSSLELTLFSLLKDQAAYFLTSGILSISNW